uniref:MIR domain-containing protein n=1 Tax=Acrobeloides nanus TaxID=290746 RepID=A0A914DI16_9BILA
CSDDYWTDDTEVKLKHMDTDYFLATSGQQYSRPISGQYEIVATSSNGYNAAWKAAEGIYMQTRRDDGL